MKHDIAPFSTALIAFTFAACASDRPPVVEQDARGNYATTADYQSMERTEFVQAMEAGLQDYETRLRELRERANELGGESLEEFAECEGNLREEQQEFENQLQIARNALANNWAKEREKTVESYFDLREALDDAYDNVLDT